MKFWTALVYPLCQAVHYNGNEIDVKIPDHPPHTPVRMVACVGEYKDQLIIVKKACIELWSRDGVTLNRTIYDPLLYSVHSVKQYGDNLIVLSSGIDFIFMIDLNGKHLWEWWGWKSGFCEEPKFIYEKDWYAYQLNTEGKTVINSMHMNSLHIEGDYLYVCALKKKIILKIKIGSQEHENVFIDTAEGCHSAIPLLDSFIYGYINGLMIGNVVALTGFHWVKFISPVVDGYVFTHEEGVTKIDKNCNHIKTIQLLRPFGLALYEEA